MMTVASTVFANALLMCLSSQLHAVSGFSTNSRIRNSHRQGWDRRLAIRYAEAVTTETPSQEMIEEAKNMMPKIVDKMPDPLPDTLSNKYYMLRHGQSTANIAEIISSSRSLAYSDKHGLTAIGYDQGKQSANQLIEILEEEGVKPGEKLIFVSSPFARARQTAEACLDGLMDNEGLPKRIESMGIEVQTEIALENRLMERYFGRLDADRIYTYAYVWPMDAFDVTHTAFDVESVAAVCSRLSEVVERCEKDFKNSHIVWVSHADVLQIGQLYAANAENVGQFSAYRFKNGEVRAVKNTPDSLPEPEPLQAPKRGTALYSELKELPGPPIK